MTPKEALRHPFLWCSARISTNVARVKDVDGSAAAKKRHLSKAGSEPMEADKAPGGMLGQSNTSAASSGAKTRSGRASV